MPVIGAVTLDQLTVVWLSGGWVMIPLVFLAFIIFFTAMELILYFRRGNHTKVSENTRLESGSLWSLKRDLQLSQVKNQEGDFHRSPPSI